MTLRQVCPDDLADIIAIEAVNFSQEEQIAPEVLSHFVNQHQATCLVMTQEDQLAGYILSCPSPEGRVLDAFFEELRPQEANPHSLAIVSLSINPAFHGQGVGSLLLAALKEVTVEQHLAGIALTCHDYLIAFYELNGFQDQGLSESQFAGGQWYDMYWKCPDDGESLLL